MLRRASAWFEGASATGRRRAGFLALALALSACARGGVSPEAPPSVPRLTPEEVAARIPAHVKDREGWAADVLSALSARDRLATATTVCQVLAVVEQESGFQSNPVVPDLGRIARRELEATADRYGPLGRAALSEVMEEPLSGKGKPFGERLQGVRTERDLDLLFRELLAHYRRRFPTTYATANALRWLTSAQSFADANPITTAGSMQVSVRFAEGLAREEEKDEAQVRDALYTRKGGLYYGVARLLGYDAAYAQPLFRFADYNSGPYSSRNAAFQEQLSKLTGEALALDGDLLAYDKKGEPLSQDSRTLQALLAFRAQKAPDLSEGQLRADVRSEKSAAFEGTATWRAVRRAYEARTSSPAPYARLPDVSLKSPKLSKGRSTAWFARSVNARYVRCLEAGD